MRWILVHHQEAWQAWDGEMVANVQYCCVHLGSFGRIICLFVSPFWSLLKQQKFYVEETQHLETFWLSSVRNHFSYSMILIRLVGDNKVSKWHWCVLMLQLLKFQCKKKQKQKQEKESVALWLPKAFILCWTDCFQPNKPQFRAALFVKQRQVCASDSKVLWCFLPFWGEEGQVRLAWGNCFKISGLTMQNQLSVFCFTWCCKIPADSLLFLVKDLLGTP